MKEELTIAFIRYLVEKVMFYKIHRKAFQAGSFLFVAMRAILGGEFQRNERVMSEYRKLVDVTQPE